MRGRPKDERETLIDLKATRTAFYVLFGGALFSIFTMHFRVNVWMLSQFVLFSIVVAELVKFARQIVLFRRGLLRWAAVRFETAIRELRFNHAEMTQQELADRIGVTRQTVNAIELGKYSPSLEVAFQIAAVFKVPLDQVFQYEKGKR